MVKLQVRILHTEGHIGPGKITLLEQVRAAGSISAAARAMGMSYRRAWYLIDTMNKALGQPVVRASVGGATGGGAELTPLGMALVERYRALETEATAAMQRLFDDFPVLASQGDAAGKTGGNGHHGA